MLSARSLLPAITALMLIVTPRGPCQNSPSTEERDRLWISVRDTMREHIKKLDEYTCIQNIIRFDKVPNERHERAVDMVRMQVTAASGREYYSWPGSPNSAENPSDLLRTGLLGTGAFQGYLHALFVRPGPGHLEFVGREPGESGPLLHFRFTFDLRERMILNVSAGRASVAAKGEFWADEKDRSLRRMRVVSAHPAPEINIKSAEYLFDWAPVFLRGRRVLLPQMSTMRMEMFSGEIRRNEISLSQCREFRTDSAVRFDAGPEPTSGGAPEPPGVIAAGFLPADLIVPIRLLSGIDTGKSAVGDVFEAEVTRDVKRKGEILLRKGDQAEGRIRYLSTDRDPELHTLLWLEITTVRSGAKEYIFLGEMKRSSYVSSLIHQAQSYTEGRLERIGVFGAYRIGHREFRSYGAVPGVASLLFRGDRVVLPAGFEIEWSTLPARTDDDAH